MMLWLCLVARVRVHADSHTTQPQQPKQPKPKKTLQKRACAALSLAAYNCAAADAAAEFVDEVRMWVFEEDYEGRKLTDVINERHENPKYLPGVPLGANVVADPDLESTVRDADVLIFCAPHQFMRSICKTLVGKVRCVWLFLSCGVLQQQRTHVSRSAARARAQQHSPSPTNHKNQQPQKIDQNNRSSRARWRSASSRACACAPTARSSSAPSSPATWASTAGSFE